MFAAFTRNLLRGLGRPRPDTVATDNSVSQDGEELDFKAMLQAAREHHDELAHACLLRSSTERCTRCYLAAARESGVQHLEASDLSSQQRREVLTLAFAHRDTFVHSCGVTGGGTCTRCLVESLGVGSPVRHTSMDVMLRRWAQKCPPATKISQQQSSTHGLSTHFSPFVAAVVRFFTSAASFLVIPTRRHCTPPAKQLQTLPASRPQVVSTQLPQTPYRVPFPLPLPYSAWYPVAIPLPLPVLRPPVTPCIFRVSPPLLLPTTSVTLQQQGYATLPEILLRQAVSQRSNVPHTCEPNVKDSTCVRCLLVSLALQLGTN